MSTKSMGYHKLWLFSDLFTYVLYELVNSKSYEFLQIMNYHNTVSSGYKNLVCPTMFFSFLPLLQRSKTVATFIHGVTTTWGVVYRIRGVAGSAKRPPTSCNVPWTGYLIREPTPGPYQEVIKLFTK